MLARAALGLGSGPAGLEVDLLDRDQLDLLEEARAGLPPDQPVLRALVTARLSVATTLVESHERRLALAAARAMGAPGLVERIQREAAAVAPPSAAGGVPLASREAVLQRVGDFWRLGFHGHEVQVRDTQGLHDLAVLLGRAGAQVAALDLARPPAARRVNALDAGAGLGLAGDSGPVIDATARDAYRRRLVDLEAELADAEACADLARQAQVAAERDLLIDQLAAAYGLGGRARRLGSDAEHARTAVTARIRDAIRRIEHVHPELGQHLRLAVRPGTFCSYQPETPIRWHLERAGSGGGEGDLGRQRRID